MSTSNRTSAKARTSTRTAAAKARDRLSITRESLASGARKTSSATNYGYRVQTNDPAQLCVLPRARDS
eukprot:scaffold84002_cov42-Prasinocladus_malaysianus.AAC.1